MARRKTDSARPAGRRPGARRPARAAASGGPALRVRMYRQGLGDCFLLTFDPDGAARHVLIDCGSLGSTTTGFTATEAMEDIVRTTGGHLDLLVATHEHWDHVSGFRSKAFQKKEFVVDRVWLAWTEDPKDPDAREIARYKNDLGRALLGLSRSLAVTSGSDPHAARSRAAIAGLAGFVHGDDPDNPGPVDPGALGASDFKASLNEAMNLARGKAGDAVTYLSPGGRVREEDWLPGFRIYVLGPPRDTKALTNLGDHGSEELYGLLASLEAAAGFHQAGLGLRAYLDRLEGGESFTQHLPFDPRFRVELKSESAPACAPGYYEPAEAWRRIDGDWLRVATDLALQLDNATNNTSLVLAIERIADGSVLLFPGDAQLGNWLSWHTTKIQWKVADRDGVERTVTARDLLDRTVFYKVGHHASHNATASAKGLQLMNDRRLVAFIPVDRAVALKKAPEGSWRMPARTLYAELLERCNGRVVRSDVGWATDAKEAKAKAVEKEFEGLVKPEKWSAWKKEQARCEKDGEIVFAPKSDSECYVDYRLP